MVSKRVDLDQIFEICLEQILSGHESLDSALASYPEEAEELRPRLETAIWLDENKNSLDPRPGFVSASRNRLISQIKEEIANPNALEIEPELDMWARVQAILFDYKRYALPLALFVLMVVITLYGGTKVTDDVQEALPGDKSYTVKIVLEEAELESNIDPIEKTRLHTEFAQTRVHEAHELVIEGRYTYIPETVDRYEYHVDEAIKSLDQLAKQDINQTEVLGATLHNVLVNQTPTLNIMKAAVPQQYKLDIERAVIVSDVGIFKVERLLVSVNRPVTPTPSGEITSGGPTGSPLGIATLTPNPNAPQQSMTSTLLPLFTSTATDAPLKPRKPNEQAGNLSATTQPTSAPTEKYLTPTKTPKPPTHTPVPPTRTPTPTKIPTLTKTPTPTNTPITPTKTPTRTNTPVPPTNTPVPPTDTPIPPTNTPVPPTRTPVPPTDVAQDPTSTQIPPEDTPAPATSEVTTNIN